MSAEAQKLLVKMYTYRVMGILFAFVGLCWFIFMYSDKANGSFIRLFEEPTLMLWLVAPFLPASLMFWLVGRTEKKLSRLLEQKEKSA